MAPCALHVRVHFNGLVEESLRRLQVPRRARLVLEPPVVVGDDRLARRLRLLKDRSIRGRKDARTPKLRRTERPTKHNAHLCVRLRLLPPGC